MALLPDTLHQGPVTLQRSRVAHLDGVLEAIAVSLRDLGHWLSWAATMPSSEAERAHLVAAEASFDDDLDWSYNLFETRTDLVVGTIGLHRRVAPDRVEIGYWVRSDRTGRGYATAATHALVTAAFAHLHDTHRVEIGMDHANRASAAIPRKLGFVLDRDEVRPIESPGHTGIGFVWVMARARWVA